MITDRGQYKCQCYIFFFLGLRPDRRVGVSLPVGGGVGTTVGVGSSGMTSSGLSLFRCSEIVSGLMILGRGGGVHLAHYVSGHGYGWMVHLISRSTLHRYFLLRSINLFDP